MQDRLIEEQRVEDLREEVYAYEKVEEQEHREKQERLERKLKRYERIEKSKPQKHILTLNIPIKSSKELNKGNLKTLQIKTLQKPLVRLVQYSALKCQLTTKVFPRLNTLRVAVEDIRIPMLKPMNIRTLATPHLKLGLGSIPDISIRPLIYQKLNKLTKTINPLFKHIRVAAYTPLTITTHIERVNTVYTPRIRLSARDVHNTTPDTLKSKEKVITEVITQEATETKEALSELGETEFEEFEPFDLIFHLKGGTLDFDEPLVICLEEPENDSYIGTVRTLCRLIYREKVGGYPEPIIIESLEEFKDELRWIKAEHRIFSVKLSKEEWSKLTDEDWIRIWSRIKQLFSQGFGVIILNTDVTPIGEHIINVVKLKPKELPLGVRKEIVELFWGVRVSDDDALKPFDLLYETARKKKDQLLKRLEKLEGGIYWDATKEDENESKLHRQIKAFIVRLLVKDLRRKGFKLETPTEIEKYVKTEFEIGDVRADVFIDKKVYEVETLFAEDRGGKTVRDKLRETFKKYENTDIKEINIILDNPTFIRHIGTILSLLRNYKDWMKEKQKIVKFYTIDIENERLVPMEEIVSKLKNIKQKIKNVQSSVD